MDLKKITQSLSNVVEDLSHIVQSPEKRIIHLLEEKGITQISRETWSEGSSVHNVIANNDGEILTDNSTDLTRILLNVALFSNHGETRLNNAMSGDVKKSFEKVEVPSQAIKSAKLMQEFIPTKQS